MNRTELRHKMLTAIREERPNRPFIYWPPFWDAEGHYDHASRSLTGSERRTLRGLDEAGLLSRWRRKGDDRRGPRMLDLRSEAEALLAEWDEKYGPVTP